MYDFCKFESPEKFLNNDMTKTSIMKSKEANNYNFLISSQCLFICLAAYLKNPDTMVIIVDWSRLARLPCT